MSMYERLPAGLRSEGGRDGGRERGRKGEMHEWEAGICGMDPQLELDEKKEREYL